MNERERRDFQAGLSEEVDAWLRGDFSRREFLTKVGQATGMIALSGTALSPLTSWAFAQADLGLADPSTPLGQAQAAAMAASTEAPADGSAFRAVEAAKQFSGVNLTMTVEATPRGFRRLRRPRYRTGVDSRHGGRRRHRSD
jgi:multiple sugar transport system substrate-binding protein